MTRQQAKRIAGAIALLLASYLGALMFLFPASIAWRLVESRLDLPVAVVADSVGGRIWTGRAAGVRVNGHDVGAISWRMMPAPLLRGRLGLVLDWHSGDDRVGARTRLGRSSVQASDLRGWLGASRIQEWFDLPVLLDGRLELDLPQIHWTAGDGFTDASGTLLWTGAGAGLPRPMRLGDYRAALTAADGSLTLQIESEPDAVLAALGGAAWHPAGEYSVDLGLRAAADADRNLSAALDTMAQRQPDGSHRLQLPPR
jgi:general secretion pathway protein N